MTEDLFKKLQSLIAFTTLGLLTCFFMVAFALADTGFEYQVVLGVYIIGFVGLMRALNSFSANR
jgi:hypothetical protein